MDDGQRSVTTKLLDLETSLPNAFHPHVTPTLLGLTHRPPHGPKPGAHAHSIRDSLRRNEKDDARIEMALW